MWLKYLCFRELEAADRRDIRLSRKSRPARLGHHRSPRPWDIIAARSEDIVIVGSLTQAARTLLRAAAVLLPCLLLAACLYRGNIRSEEHTSELQSLMRISYAVFCLKKTNKNKQRSKVSNT